MLLPPDSAGRRYPVHYDPVEKHNRASMLFVTVCTKDRKHLLANATVHTAVVDWWRKSTHWLAGKYIILPDHIHLFCALGDADQSLHRRMAYWKNGMARELKTGDEIFWQRDFWDTQMRSRENFESQWEYIRHNPVRHGLVKSPDDWPYQGEVHLLDWHE